jgi:transmembrane sensor
MSDAEDRFATVKDQAANWVLKHDRGLSATEQDEFLQWLAASPRHKAEFAAQRENWQRLDVLGQWRPEHGARPNRDLLAPRRLPKGRVIRRWVAWTGAIAAAAGLAFSVRLTVVDEPTPELRTQPDSIAAIESRQLPDGSTVELNRGASVSVLFTPSERRVLLEQGEVHFTVAKNPARPFIVSAAGVDVRAVGTAFNVRLGRQAVEVLVTEGKVQVEKVDFDPSNRGKVTVVPSLERGQRSVVSLTGEAAPQVAAVSVQEMDQLLAWQPRLLDFAAAPLRTVVAEFNRRNSPVRLVILDPDLAEIEVSASLRSDNVEGFIRLLDAGFGVRAERQGTEIRLSR